MFLANMQRNSNLLGVSKTMKGLNYSIKSNNRYKSSALFNKSFSESCSKQMNVSNLSEADIKKHSNIEIKIEKGDTGFGLDKSNVLFFDFQSTTPIDPRVLDAMLPYMTYQYGNPHSKSHEFGWNAEKAVETSRKVINNLIKKTLSSIIKEFYVISFSCHCYCTPLIFLNLYSCVFLEKLDSNFVIKNFKWNF